MAKLSVNQHALHKNHVVSITNATKCTEAFQLYHWDFTLLIHLKSFRAAFLKTMDELSSLLLIYTNGDYEMSNVGCLFSIDRHKLNSQAEKCHAKVRWTRTHTHSSVKVHVAWCSSEQLLLPRTPLSSCFRIPTLKDSRLGKQTRRRLSSNKHSHANYEIMTLWDCFFGQKTCVTLIVTLFTKSFYRQEISYHFSYIRERHLALNIY